MSHPAYRIEVATNASRYVTFAGVLLLVVLFFAPFYATAALFRN
jgi:hypothetical protein